MNKSAITFLLAAAAGPALPADSTGSAVDALVACSTIQDMSSRLACFDREIAPLAAARAQSALPAPAAVAAPAPAPAPAVVAVPPPPAPPEHAAAPMPARPSFGEEQLNANQRAPAPEHAQVLHAHIADQKPAGTGRFLVYLDNGQVWRHEDAYLGGYLKQGEAITITRASLGSYRLTRDAGQAKNWIRVTRVR